VNILLTGGAGYIGSVLAAHLLQHKHSVTILDSLLFGGHSLLGILDDPGAEFMHGDIRDPFVTEKAVQDKDIVIHLAALVGEPQCNQDPQVTEDVNFLSTRRLVNQAKGAGVKRFIFASTCSNYGVSDKGLADEDTELKPLSLYAETKVRAEAEVRDAADDEYQTTILRFATAYGLSPRMRFDLLLNEFVRDAVVRGYLLVYGMNSWRPFVHVRDIARFVCRCVEHNLSGTYNVGGHNLRKSDLVEILLEMVPELDLDIKEGKRDPRNYRVSFERAKGTGYVVRRTPGYGMAKIAKALGDGVFQDPYSKAHRNA
jgi:nucleoside-diphosphate-sugar epimerase